MQNEEQKRPVSPENRAAKPGECAALHGRRKGGGKERASRNACWHGLFSRRLFPTAEQQSEDGEDCDLIPEGVVDSESIEFMD